MVNKFNSRIFLIRINKVLHNLHSFLYLHLMKFSRVHNTTQILLKCYLHLTGVIIRKHFLLIDQFYQFRERHQTLLFLFKLKLDFKVLILEVEKNCYSKWLKKILFHFKIKEQVLAMGKCNNHLKINQKVKTKILFSGVITLVNLF